MEKLLLGVELGSSFLQLVRKSGLCLPPPQHCSGRYPYSLIILCRGARPGPRLSRLLLSSFRRVHNRGLLLGLFLGGLLGGVFNNSRRLSRFLADDVARINIRRHTGKIRYHASITTHNNKKTNNKEEV